MDRIKLIAYLLLRRHYSILKIRQRRYWIHPLSKGMNPNGEFFSKKYEALKIDEKKFVAYFRMSISSFEELLSELSKYIQKKKNKGRKPVTALEMLGLTLRFLATGSDFKTMHTNYFRGASTIAKIVRTVCRAIWKHLSSQNIPPITKQVLEDVAIEFDKKANFPNCIGALGKHVRITCPAHSGSLFYNYKGYNSIVLLALVDSRYRFIFVDIGAYGKESDSTVFQNSKLYDLIMTRKLPIPVPKPLPGSQNETPFVFVGDEAFSISNNVMRPYSGKHLSVQQRVYNYRLSRARRYVECAFGILVNKWRIFHRSMNVQYEFATDIIKACCVMHNFVLNRDGVQATDDIIFDDSDLQMLHLPTANENNLSPHLIRNDFCNYFSSDVGALSWQLNKI
ncbi:protein ALP1-like [Pararge aegeria]|uniref:protein ALP1-like n=1 Tax=Pararge aegeria TaxID=116150 RepID=UPI0019D199EB|nr:protein ALP1-like [Pararge aegeria]